MKRANADWIKRLFDLAVVLTTAPLWLPVLALVALLVRCRLGRPVLFRQVRPGRHGRPFTLVKFRTMTLAGEASTELRSEAERLAPFGRWLRSVSLDELPELSNVLRGEMSLVGPRPLLLEYLDRYTPEQARRHEVRPGLTGLAQVSGRNRLPWEERFRLDVWYVDHRSLWLDLQILFRTIWRVLARDGIEPESGDLMVPFSASPSAGGQVSAEVTGAGSSGQTVRSEGSRRNG
jgi:sugar transferase EpsL